MIKEINDKNVWETFIRSCDQTPFFQSWAWGEVQVAQGHEVMRLMQMDKDNNPLSVCQLIVVKAKRGKYIHLRHGPVYKEFDEHSFKEFNLEIKRIAIEQQVDFIRAGFLLDSNHTNEELVSDLGFKRRIGHNQDAEETLIIDLSLSEEEISKLMRKNTRYYIRKAYKDGVKIEKIDEYCEKVDDFINFYNESTKILNYTAHKGIKEEFKELSKDGNILLINGIYNNEVLASGLFVYYNNQAVYHHSATSKKHPNISASYLMLWEAILEAKRRGMKVFDLWGYVKDKDHPWYGFSLFKLGFTKLSRQNLHVQDLAITKKYYLIRLYEWYEMKKKHY